MEEACQALSLRSHPFYANTKEFVFDLQGQIVLHGCWAVSLCNDRGPARRFRASRLEQKTPQVIWREQKAFEVPKLVEQKAVQKS